MSSRALLEEILADANIEEATMKHLPAITQLFVDLTGGEMEKARKDGNRDRMQKLQTVLGVLQRASAPRQNMPCWRNSSALRTKHPPEAPLRAQR